MRLAVLLLSILATPALAQQLPEWAAPVPAERGPAAGAPSYDLDDLLAADPPPPPPMEVPVDGGLTLLALAGAALAARKLRTA